LGANRKTAGLRQHLAVWCDRLTASTVGYWLPPVWLVGSDVDAGLLPQTVHPARSSQGRGSAAAHAMTRTLTEAFERVKNRQLLAAFHTERQLDEIR